MSREVTIMDVCVSRLGIIKGSRCISDLGAWAFVMSVAGDDWPEGDARGVLTERVRLFADAFGYSERTAWRRVHAFRECFPGEADPTRMVRELGIQAPTKDDPRAFMGIGLVRLPAS